MSGIVQGVGFRPTALRLANEYKLGGEVKNTGGGVTLTVQGGSEDIKKFFDNLRALFSIENYSCAEVTTRKKYTAFHIETSKSDGAVPFILPDIATCCECEAELKNKNSRRYRHPFISCVNCGPRYSIIKTLPYDRENTVMDRFCMCKKCEKEYKNPLDRRCHAQTIACNSCGPKTDISIEEAADILKEENVLAIKGIGGYHLACVCTDNAADKIRKIKKREKKPFAVMFSSLEQIRQYCSVSKKEEELLLSPARPIVLLHKTKNLPDKICGESDFIGAFLPCDPIHIMLLGEVSPLVMTSANVSGEPIITNDKEIEKLGCSVLSHNREILTPLDDSVVRTIAGRTFFIRRARGYVPLAIKINKAAKADSICMGGDLKSSFALTHGNYVFCSQYFGDLENPDCEQAYKKNIARFCALHGIEPKATVCDRHPGYFSSKIFNPSKKVQHHLAHAYSVIAEHGLTGDVLSFVFDGTGYGDDGAIWGAEVFLNKTRVEHMAYTPMPSSDETAKNAHLALECYKKSNPLINKAIEKNINITNYSGMGRLFDAVCALLKIKDRNTYEGECACALESAARRAKKAYELTPSWNPSEIINQIETADAAVEELALGFHKMLAQLILNTAKKYNTKQITLSGGCFINEILTESAISLLEENGFSVFTNEKVSCGDNGIALGQAYLYADEEQEK